MALQSDFIHILNSARNGYLYGTRLRLAHSITTFLFFNKIKSSKDFKNKIIKILKNSQSHGISLGLFALLYKCFHKVLSNNFKNKKLNHFLSGCLAGYLIFTNDSFNSGITQQVTLYIFARVVLGIFRIVGERVAFKMFQKKYGSSLLTDYKYDSRFKRIQNNLNNKSWKVLVTLTWGSIMVIWNSNKDVLNYSTLNSMNLIYTDYDFSSIIDFFRNIYVD